MFNLGGPASLDTVRPFLKNMFMDRAILGGPLLLRYFLAELISRRRTPVAQEIYQEIGGRSPINEETGAQLTALQSLLNKKGAYKVFYFQRYWHPMAEEVLPEVMKYNPDEVILLPLYPQYSTTTTASSVGKWREQARINNLNKRLKIVCCYPTNPGFISAVSKLTREKYDEAVKLGKPRVLFSAHGIPQNRVTKGDPYQMHIEATVRAVVKKLAISDLDYKICYQSRVGPLKWLEPSTEFEISKAAAEKTPIVIVPIAFVSEHSETLVELDIKYKKLYTMHGGPGYFRVSTVRTHEDYIAGLAELVVNYKEKNCSYNSKTCLIANFK